MSVPHKTHPSLQMPHGFFGRQGGISSGLYDSLNTGLGSADIPENVIENRRRIAAVLDVESDRLLNCHQIHSPNVIIAEGPWPGARPKADGVVTNVPGLACAALSADCAPVLFCDAKNGIIGAAHAGWRGAVTGVTDRAILAMESLGADRANIAAVVGPCITGANYEVGEAFKVNAMEFDSGCEAFFMNGRSGKPHFALKAYVVARLKSAQINTVDAITDCTYALPDAYFSYRYNTHLGQKDYGRNLSAIALPVL